MSWATSFKALWKACFGADVAQLWNLKVSLKAKISSWNKQFTEQTLFAYEVYKLLNKWTFLDIKFVSYRV